MITVDEADEDYACYSPDDERQCKRSAEDDAATEEEMQLKDELQMSGEKGDE